MSTSRIRVVVDFDIYEGKFAEFEAIAKQMVADIEPEPGTLCFHFVLSADRTRCRLIEGYADQAAITAHFVDGPAVHQHIHGLQQACFPGGIRSADQRKSGIKIKGGRLQAAEIRYLHPAQ